VDRAEIEVGQQVIVLSGNRWPTQADTPGVVTQAARVWITVAVGDYGREQRFRLDTQTDGSTIGVPDRFYTMEQWAETQRNDAARAFLHEQGIYLQPRSPWCNCPAQLVDLIKARRTL